MRNPWLSEPLHCHGNVLQIPLPFRVTREKKPVVECIYRFPSSSTPSESEASEYASGSKRYKQICSKRNVFVRSAASPGPSHDFAHNDDDDDDNDAFEWDKELSHYRGLVLDVTYRPINVVCWRRALCLEILEKADVLEYYDQVISSPSRPFAIPAVLRITDYIHSPKRMKVKLPLNRRNIFLRDKFQCQYCHSHDHLTVDHVIPVSRGGEWIWKNLVTACSKCNSRKGDKTPEEAHMKLIKMPREPGMLDGRDMPSNYAAYRVLQRDEMPSEWIDYLPKKTHMHDN